MNVGRLERFHFVSFLIVVSAFILPSLIPANARADRTWNEAGWSMSFDDEFNSNAVNAAKWNINDGPNGGNNEAEYYSPNNVYEANGYLVLESKPQAIQDSGGAWYYYTSGKVTTAGKWDTIQGRIEIRAKLPTGKGIWPAHWMLDYLTWPPEIDITEMVGSVPDNLVVGHHCGPIPEWCVECCGGYPWNCGLTENTTVYWDMDWTANWHTFALEWQPSYLAWSQDGVTTFTGYRCIPTNSMFLILNTAVGGDWPGWPDSTTQWPQYHLIDYVRAYKNWDGQSLPNGDFEWVEDNAFPNWNTVNDNGNIVPDDVSQNALDGQHCAKMFGRFDTATNTSWLIQSQTASAGQIWQASVWAANRPQDLISLHNTARFKLEFYDGSWNLLAQYALTAVNSNTAPSYTQYTIRQEAPTNSSYVRVVMEFNQFNYETGAADFDDAELIPITSQTVDSLRVLVNGDFEEGDGNDFPSWNFYGATSNIEVETAPINIDQGKRSVRILAESDGLVPETGLYQDIPARPAETWTAGVWAQNRVGDQVQGSNTAALSLEFLDANGVILQSNAVKAVDKNTVPGYTNVTVTGTSPANTAFARIVLKYQQAAGGGGSVNFDLASLSTVTAVGTLVNAGLQLYDGTNFPGWVTYSAGWNVVPDALAINTRTGTSAVQMFGQYPGNGAANESGVYQDLPAADGQVWQASVWAENRPNDLTQGANQGVLKIEFHDTSGNLLDSDQLTVVASNSPSYYQQFFLKRLAPPSTATARIVLAYDQVNDAGGSADFTAPTLAQLTVHDPRPVLNSSFEDGSLYAFPNWAQYGTNFDMIHEPITNYVNSGKSAVQVWGALLSSYDNTGLYQDFPAQPLEMWQASVWAQNRPFDQLWPGNIANLKMEFYDTNDNLIATNNLTILDGSSSTNYQWYATRMIAPWGTSRARVVLEMVQTNWLPGSCDFDDADMEVLSSTNANRQLLDGGFEAGQGTQFSAWVPYGVGSSTNILRDGNTNNAHGGTQCLQMFGDFNGQDNWCGIYQDIPAAAGEFWQASVWARSRPGDMMQASNSAPIALEFHDYWGNYLQGDSLTAVDWTSDTNYTWYAIRDWAPWGTAYARIVFQYHQPNSAFGSANFDDADLALITAQSNPQLLNGGFEYRGINNDFINWTRFNAGFNTLIDPDSTNAHSGSRCVQMFGRFTNTWNNSDLYQTLPAAAGQVWQAGVWVRNRPGDSLQGFNQALLKLEYLDAYNNTLSVSEQVVADATTTTNYQPCAVMRQAPTGTAWARITLEVDQTAYAPGSVNFDDASLVQVASLNGLQPLGRVLWDGDVPLAGAASIAGNLILNPGMNLNVNINGPNPGLPGYGQITASSVTINGNLNIVLPTSFNSQAYVPRAGQSFTIISAPAINGRFSALNGPTGMGGGPAFALVYTPTSVVLQVVADLDSDNNGLPDYWEQQYFHTLTGTSPTADPDGDGMSNLQEFLADTNPTNAASYFHIQSIAPNPGGGIAVSYQSSSNRVYTLYYTDAFNSGVWSNIPTATSVPGTGGLQTLIDPATNLTHRTYKVMVQLPH